ncbi:MAG TPA: hypothetical protein VFR02_07490, partial [bacterium]|nr:hypothetical protein [bacterium]
WTPQGVRESGLATNPVHVLDLALVLPGMAWTGTALLRGKGWAYRFFPAWMVFIILMAWALAGMAAALWARGLAAGLAPALIFLAVSAVGSAVLAVYWRKFTALA